MADFEEIDTKDPSSLEQSQSGNNSKGQNVTVLLPCNVTQLTDGRTREVHVFIPDATGMAALRKPKKRQFVRDIKFTSTMTKEDVERKLCEKFEILRNQRFCCASALGSRAKLDKDNRTNLNKDNQTNLNEGNQTNLNEGNQTNLKLNFHGERRIWDGAFIKNLLKEHSALYILIEGTPESQQPTHGPANQEMIPPAGGASLAVTRPLNSSDRLAPNPTSHQKRKLDNKTAQLAGLLLQSHPASAKQKRLNFVAIQPPADYGRFQPVLQHMSQHSSSSTAAPGTHVGSNQQVQPQIDHLATPMVQNTGIPWPVFSAGSEQSLSQAWPVFSAGSLQSPSQAIIVMERGLSTRTSLAAQGSLPQYCLPAAVHIVEHKTDPSKPVQCWQLANQEQGRTVSLESSPQLQFLPESHSNVLLQTPADPVTPATIQGSSIHSGATSLKNLEQVPLPTCTQQKVPNMLPVESTSKVTPLSDVGLSLSKLQTISTSAGAQENAQTSEQGCSLQQALPAAAVAAAAAAHKNVPAQVLNQETTSRKSRPHGHQENSAFELLCGISDGETTDSAIDSMLEDTTESDHVTGQSGDILKEICPNKGSIKGGDRFHLIVDFVPLEIEWYKAIFQGCGEVYLQRASFSTLAGITPASLQGSGKVKVTLMSLDGSWWGGETEFLYTEDPPTEEEFLTKVVKDRNMRRKLFDRMDKEMSSNKPSDEQTSDSSGKTGPRSSSLNQSRYAWSVKLLQLLVYKAAEIDGHEFIQMIFSTSAGKVVFNSYRNSATLPEDVARANGHSTLANHLQDVNSRLSKESNSDARTEGIDWLELKHAVDKEQSLPSDTDDVQILKKCRPPGYPESDDDDESDYSADDEMSPCSSPSHNKVSDSEHEDHSQNTKMTESSCEKKVNEENNLQLENNNLSVSLLHLVGNQLEVNPSIKAENAGYRNEQLESDEVKSHTIANDILIGKEYGWTSFKTDGNDLNESAVTYRSEVENWDTLGSEMISTIEEASTGTISLHNAALPNNSSHHDSDDVMATDGSETGLDGDQREFKMIDNDETTRSRDISAGEESSSSCSTRELPCSSELRDAGRSVFPGHKDANDNGVYCFIRDLIVEGKDARLVNKKGRYVINWSRALKRYHDYKSKRNPQYRSKNINRRRASNGLRAALINVYKKEGAKEYKDCKKVNEKDVVIERQFQMPPRVFESLFGSDVQLSDDSSEHEKSSIASKADENSLVTPNSSDTGFDEAMYISDAIVPAEILTQGDDAKVLYEKALRDGAVNVYRGRIVLIGQDRAGKTSLKRSLLGLPFEPEHCKDIGSMLAESCYGILSKVSGTESEEEEEKDEGSGDKIECKDERSLFINQITENENKVKETDISSPARDMQAGNDSGSVTTKKKSGLMIDASTPPDDITKQADQWLKNMFLKDADAESAPTKTESFVTLDLWDFAGQHLYYFSHPVFFSLRAVYILLHNLSEPLNAPAKPCVLQGTHDVLLENPHNETNLENLLSWLVTVHSLKPTGEEMVDSSDGTLPYLRPPVLIVGTHADMPFEDIKSMTSQIQQAMSGKEYEKHVIRPFFSIDNTENSISLLSWIEKFFGKQPQRRHQEGQRDETGIAAVSGIHALRTRIMEVLRHEPYMGEKIPVRWFNFEKVIEALVGENIYHVHLEQLHTYAKEICFIEDEEEFNTMMNFYHNLRVIVKYRSTVVLKAQWLIDLFRQLITIPPFDKVDPVHSKFWQEVEQSGILRMELVDHIFSRFIQRGIIKEDILDMMEQFGLIAKFSLSPADVKYFVLAQLKSSPKCLSEMEPSPSDPCPLYLHFVDGFVPHGLFSQLISKLTSWCSATGCTQPPNLYQNGARFVIGTHNFFLVRKKRFIKMLLKHRTQEDASMSHSAEVARSVRLFVEGTLGGLSQELPYLSGLRYEFCVACPYCLQDDNKCDNHSQPSCAHEDCLHLLEIKQGERLLCMKGFGDDVLTVRGLEKWFPRSSQEESPSNVIGTSQDAPLYSFPENCDEALKVTLLASEWSSSMGDLSTINRILAIRLARHMRVEVTLLVPQFACSEEKKRAAQSHNIVIREAERCPGYNDPLDWLSFPPRDLAIDIVVGHGVKFGKQAQVIRESHNCKWMQVVHTAPEELSMHKNYAKAISRVEGKIRTEVDLCKVANLVVAVGPKLTEAYSSYLPSCENHQDIIQLTPGISSEFLAVKQATNESDKFRVLIFGRGDPEDLRLKGCDIAAKAIVELKDRTYRLIFVGAPDGKQEEVAENLLQSGISKDQLTVRTFTRSKKRLKQLLCEVDLAIMPSRTEGFGLTALEAMSAGLPILVSGNSGFGDALRVLPLGKPFVVESNEPTEWAKAITAVRLKDRAQRLQEIQTLRTCYEETYSWEKQCEALVQKMWSIAYD